MNKYKWKIKEPLSREVIDKFPEINPAVLQLLYDRGLTTQEQIDEFLNPDYSQDIHDPYLFTQMSLAVERIYLAKEKKEQVVIYGDYDADGVPGTAVLASWFRKVGAPARIYIPNRHTEDYGLSERALRELAGGSVTLLITVDCGISNAAEVALAKELGMDVIITDHHLKAEKTPKALTGVLVAAFDFEDGLPGHDGLLGIGMPARRHLALRHQDIAAFHPISQRMHARTGGVLFHLGPDLDVAAAQGLEIHIREPGYLSARGVRGVIILAHQDNHIIPGDGRVKCHPLLVEQPPGLGKALPAIVEQPDLGRGPVLLVLDDVVEPDKLGLQNE